MDDLVDVYNNHGWRIGMALRSECHGNPSLLHHTSHVVVFHPDGGRILLQKAVEILPGDTAELLQRRVMEQAEWKLLPQAAEMLAAAMMKEKENMQ